MSNSQIPANKLFVSLLLQFILLLSGADFIMAQQSTTGPVPPPDIDLGIIMESVQQVTIGDVPPYIWHHGCGPTAVGMVVGYWDMHGFPQLVEGSSAQQTVAVDAMIADDRQSPNCSLEDGDHYQDYCCPLDENPGPILRDYSETGSAHESNCVADFMRTSWSAEGNYYGWSWLDHIPESFTGYINHIQPGLIAGSANYIYDETLWNRYKAEIDAGRPAVILIDTDGDGFTDHFATGIGYDESPNRYAIFNTWDNSVHWLLWKSLPNQWGVYSITTFELSQNAPTLTEWGKLIMGLLLLGLGTAAVTVRHNVPSLARSSRQ